MKRTQRLSKRILLKVKCFPQKENDCAVAAACSIANYYDPTITYKNVIKTISAKDRKNGLFTSQQARILNQLGFGKISIVTTDLDLVDFSWQNLNKTKIIKKLKQVLKHVRQHKLKKLEPTLAELLTDIIDWLETPDCDNNLIIDNDFPKYIRKSLKNGRPIGISINAR